MCVLERFLFGTIRLQVWTKLRQNIFIQYDGTIDKTKTQTRERPTI